MGWRHERERPQDQSVYITLLENRGYLCWTWGTQRGLGLFDSSWWQLLQQVAWPNYQNRDTTSPFPPFCREHVRRWHPVYGWLYNIFWPPNLMVWNPVKSFLTICIIICQMWNNLGNLILINSHSTQKKSDLLLPVSLVWLVFKSCPQHAVTPWKCDKQLKNM